MIKPKLPRTSNKINELSPPMLQTNNGAIKKNKGPVIVSKRVQIQPQISSSAINDAK